MDKKPKVKQKQSSDQPISEEQAKQIIGIGQSSNPNNIYAQNNKEQEDPQYELQRTKHKDLEEKFEWKIEYPDIQQPMDYKQKEITNSNNVQIKQKLWLEDKKESESNKKSDYSRESNKSISMLICIQDAEVIPQVNLQASPKGHKFISVKIPMYRTTTFMKIETQIFLLEVTKPGAAKDYQIQRRYSDFVQLYEQLFYNQPGYILAPFPDKSLQSFIKIKLGLGTSQPGERCQMIEKRILELERFINFVTHHHQLSNSQQLANFLTQDETVYEEGRKRLQKYMTQNRALEKNSQIKNIISVGKSLWSYFKHQQKPKPIEMTIGKNDIQFGVIYETVKTQKERAYEKYKLSYQLAKAQKSFSQFVDMPTENDLLLRLCAKHSSGKQFCKRFLDFLEVNIIDEYHYNMKRFQQIEKALAYRLQIWQCCDEAKKEGNVQKKSKLSRRLQMLEKNFLNDWQNVFIDIQKKNQLIHEKFVKEWKANKESMRKIWKPRDSN